MCTSKSLKQSINVIWLNDLGNLIKMTITVTPLNLKAISWNINASIRGL